jgi:hypothetical protein
MDEYDSGGRSADKAPGADEEGSTPPLPEKVVFNFDFFFRSLSFFHFHEQMLKM